MSVISTFYDNLNIVITNLFPSKMELCNPYDLPSTNPEPVMRNGYGVTWDSGTYDGTLKGTIYEVERNVGVVFTKRVFRTDLNKVARREVEKELLENVKTLIDEIKINNLIIDTVEYFEFANDDGIQFIIADKKNFVSLKANFIVRYSEIL